MTLDSQTTSSKRFAYSIFMSKARPSERIYFFTRKEKINRQVYGKTALSYRLIKMTVIT